MQKIMPSWKCSAPEYIRAVENGAQTFMYRFRIAETPHDILTVTKGLDQDSLRRALVEYSLIDDEYKSFLTDFFTYILDSYGRYFNKKYTAQQYVSSLLHQFVNIPIAEGGSAVEQTCVLNPVELLMKNGKLILRWSVDLASMMDFELEEASVVEAASEPAMAAPAPVGVAVQAAAISVIETTPVTTSAKAPTNSVESDVMIELEDVDSSPESNEIMPIRSGHHSMSDKQVRDRQRVEEARLRAKLAAVRAERALERYIEKYGTYETDDSSYDGETTDDDSE
jgi:hypothetical protein